MKNCTDCKYADWHRTAAGRLHPSGDGKCTYEYKLPPLPSCRWWMSSNPPEPNGGYINRRRNHIDHCPFYARKMEPKL